MRGEGVGRVKDMVELKRGLGEWIDKRMDGWVGFRG